MIEEEFVSDFSVIDFNKINDTVIFFQDREEQTKKVLDSQVNFIDPSI